MAYGTKVVPDVGTVRTNDWYGLYQCLVLSLPVIGTMMHKCKKERKRQEMPTQKVMPSIGY
ncbi:MAG: hypothetical protein SPI30_07255 [Prevotella sp.]|nr:hypothetical protein [Prevotella sp.]